MKMSPIGQERRPSTKKPPGNRHKRVEYGDSSQEDQYGKQENGIQAPFDDRSRHLGCAKESKKRAAPIAKEGPCPGKGKVPEEDPETKARKGKPGEQLSRNAEKAGGGNG